MSSAFSLQIASVLRQDRLLPRNARAVVAVSGGLDSVVLLQVLRELSSTQGWSLHVAHFNHQLRGRASDADERFVRRLAAQAALPCSVGRQAVRAAAAERGVSIEMAARTCRHDFLARVAQDTGAGRVVLAHHADDQVELFLLRLLRGSGPQGLQGMRTVAPSPSCRRIRLIRPLLARTRAEVLAEARLRGLRWREDASNRTLDPLRNRIRRQLLPLIREDFQPGIVPVILRTMEILREEGELAEGVLKEWKTRLGRVDWRLVPVAVQRRWVRQQLAEQGIQADFDLTERLRRRPNVAWSVAPALRARLDDQGRLQLDRSAAESFRADEVGAALAGRTGQVCLAGRQVHWRLLRRRDQTGWRRHIRPGVEVFDADRLGPSILLRYWRPGDRFQPIGLEQRAKLQNLFVAARVPRSERRQRLIGENAEGEVFWVEGLRIGEHCRVTEGTHRLLVWRWS